MQRIVSIILIFAYCGATAATDIHLHYCNGRWMTAISMIQSESAINHDTGCHQKCGKKDCCKHPQLQVKFNTNQLPVGIYIYHPYYFTSFFSYVNSINRVPVFAADQQSVSAHSPPLPYLTTINARQAFYGIFLI